MSARPNQKNHILDAAGRIVQRAGAGNLTIDAVAAEARLSKGGVLYHFPNKRALLQGMLTLRLEDIATSWASHQGPQPDCANEPLAAWILAAGEENDEAQSMGMALLAAAAEDPTLLEPAREFIKATFDDIRASGPDGDYNLILLLATEGLRLLDMFRLMPLEGAERDALQSRLLQLASVQPA